MIKRWKLGVTALILSVWMLSPALAASIADVNFDDTVTVDGKSLALNGMGLRTATMIKVKIYAIGLYLEEKSSDPKAIIASPGNKQITMQFMHDVTADQLTEGWSEGFENNNKDISGIKDEIAQFNASMSDVKTGDSIVLTVSGGKVDVSINGSVVDSIDGEGFVKAMMGIWLGPKPPNGPLKKGILGG